MCPWQWSIFFLYAVFYFCQSIIIFLYGAAISNTAFFKTIISAHWIFFFLKQTLVQRQFEFLSAGCCHQTAVCMYVLCVIKGSAADLCKMAMIRIFNLVSSSSVLSARYQHEIMHYSLNCPLLRKTTKAIMILHYLWRWASAALSGLPANWINWNVEDSQIIAANHSAGVNTIEARAKNTRIRCFLFVFFKRQCAKKRVEAFTVVD